MFNKRNYILILFAGIILSLSSCGNNKNENIINHPGEKQSLVNWADEYIKNRVKEDKLDGGLSVMIYSDGEIIYTNGTGWANKEEKKKVTEETPMPVGSISKIFTSVAIMKLAEEGKINLDESIGNYLPLLKLVDSKEMNITVRNLLTHHSGIQGDLFADWFDTDNDVLYELLKNRPLAAETGKLHSYNNIGFSLLGLIIEEVSGVTYSDFIRNEIFVPAGMNNSLVYADEIEKELPRGYDKGGSISVPVLRDIPAGGLVISADDMGKFVKALYGGNSLILKEETLEQMLTVQNENNTIDRDFEIGLGFWLIDPMNTGVLNASHGGDLPPFHSILLTLPDSDLAVFTATNDHKKDGLVAINAALEIAEEVMVWSGMDRPVALDKGDFLPVSEKTQDLFSGTYDTLAGVIEVEPNNDAFQLTLSGKKLYFAPRKNGRYGVEFRIFNKIALPIPQLKVLEFDMFEAEGNVWMSLWMKGIYMGAFSKLDDVEYPDTFEKFVGDYEIHSEKNILEDGSKAIDNINISRKNGRFLMGMSMLGQNVEIALRPDGSSRALTDGTGRAMGDLLEFKENNGEILLEWSGFHLSKKE